MSGNAKAYNTQIIALVEQGNDNPSRVEMIMTTILMLIQVYKGINRGCLHLPKQIICRIYMVINTMHAH